jgi:hypothetical protein
MKYRKLDANGDFSFGRGNQNFLVDSPQAVAQAIKTTLALYQGEWFIDTSVGMPWLTQVIGFNTQSIYDDAIKSKVQQVSGVTSIDNYTSTLDRPSRILTVSMKLTTDFSGQQIVVETKVQVGYGIGGYGGRPYGE